MPHDTYPKWYEHFFTELPNAFWRAAVSAEQTAADVDFIWHVARLTPGSHVLDIPCGSGRHSLELARRGCRVTALDISPEAVAFATAAATAENLDVAVRQGDMQEPPLDIRVDAAICMGNSFGYLEHGATRRMLAALADVIVASGALVLDYAAAAELVLPHPFGSMSLVAGGIEAEADNRYEVEHARLVTTFAFRRAQQTKRATAVQHVYTVAELSRLVAEVGFADVSLYGDVNGAPFELGGSRLLLVARRTSRTGN